jgi:gluconolactonase
MEKLAEGFEWSEGPAWDKAGNRLLFSDVPQNVVYEYGPGRPGVTEHLRPSGFTGAEPRGGEPGSNGLAFDAGGNLVLCQHGDRRVARWDKAAKKFVTIADRYDGKRFNSPNDLCFDSKGNLYFTDPPYGLPKNMEDPTKELPYQGVYRVSPDGKVTLLNKDVTRPNGIALSPDERTLYVASSDPTRRSGWRSR